MHQAMGSEPRPPTKDHRPPKVGNSTSLMPEPKIEAHEPLKLRTPSQDIQAPTVEACYRSPREPFKDPFKGTLV